MKRLNIISPYYFHVLLIALTGAYLLHISSPLFYTLEINAIKQEQRSVIKEQKDATEYIHYTISDSVFYKNYDPSEHEIRLDDNMYEVISYRSNEGKTYCTLLFDSKETCVRQHLAEHFREQKTKQITKSPFSWCPLFFERPLINFWLTLAPRLKYIVCRTSNTLLGYYTDTLKPPEWLC